MQADAVAGGNLIDQLPSPTRRRLGESILEGQCGVNEQVAAIPRASQLPKRLAGWLSNFSPMPFDSLVRSFVRLLISVKNLHYIEHL